PFRSPWLPVAYCSTATRSRPSTRPRSRRRRTHGVNASLARSRRRPPRARTPPGDSPMSLFTRTIVKKRDGGALAEGEIRDFVRGVTEGEIPDEQTAALLMAICCRGMTTEETAWLTDAM